MSEELEEVTELLRKYPDKPPPDKALKFLRLVRELKIADPEGVARYGAAVLPNTARGLVSEEEYWLLNEQVAVACLTIGHIQFAAQLIRLIARRFPNSLRADRLKGMYWEAQGQPEQALQIYNDMLAKQPNSEVAAKRLVALAKSKGNLTAAAEALQKYLDSWPADRDGWEELGDIYLQLLMYRQALFCYEELLMLAPGHLPYIIRYADLLYTLGGNNNLKIARTYYSKAVEVSGGRSVRALWGVTACCVNTTDKVALQDSLTRALIELPGLAADALQQQYRQHAPKQLPVIQKILEDSSSS